MRSADVSLLIGVTGFIGRNLTRYLDSKGKKVVGTYISPLEAGTFSRRVRLVRCDVTRPAEIKKILKRFRPRYIYYLAAQSSVRHAWLKPVETFQINFLGGVYLLEALRELDLDSKVLIFSSGTTYGESHQGGKALSEDAPLRPKDPYSLSKMSIDLFGRLYAKVHGMAVTVVRLANFTGPGQSTVFSIPNFASQIAQIEAGRKLPVIEVGNLSARRDYLDIRDGVRAFYLAMTRGKQGEVYNIASGTSRRLEEVLAALINASKLKKNSVRIKRKSTLIPKDEIFEIKLNPKKFMRLTGWRPQFTFSQTMQAILNDWRIRARKSSQ